MRVSLMSPTRTSKCLTKIISVCYYLGMKHIRVRSQRWVIQDPKILPVGELGECDWEERLLTIPDDGDTRDELDTCIHELLHAQYPDLTERQVRGGARLLSGWLWSRGWRKEI